MTEMLSAAVSHCIAESLFKSFGPAEVKQTQILFFNMHIITSKLVTNNLHTQYINIKFKSRYCCLSFIGKVVSPSTCLIYQPGSILPITIDTCVPFQKE